MIKVGRKKFSHAHFFFILLSISILLHSAIDFDMSFVYISSIVFLSLGIMISSSDNTPLKWGYIQKKPFSKIMKLTYSLSVMILALVMAFVSLNAINASTKFAQAMSTQTTSAQELIQSLSAAISKSPRHPDYTLQKVMLNIQLYQQTENVSFLEEALTLIHNIEKNEKFNKQLLYQKNQVLILLDDTEEAIKSIHQGLARFPWEINFYEQAINYFFYLGVNSNDGIVRQENFNHALRLFNDILGKIDTIEKKFGRIPYSMSSIFSVTDRIALRIGQIYYFQEDFVSAASVLEQNLHRYVYQNIDDPNKKEIVRWYLVSLLMQGQDHQRMREQFLKKYPSEEQIIQSLVQGAILFE